MSNDLKATLEADGFQDVTVTETPTLLEVTASGGVLGSDPISGKSRKARHQVTIDEDTPIEAARALVLAGFEQSIIDVHVDTHKPQFGIPSIKRKIAKQFAHRGPAEIAALEKRAHARVAQLEKDKVPAPSFT